jgi:hypothetical protein
LITIIQTVDFRNRLRSQLQDLSYQPKAEVMSKILVPVDFSYSSKNAYVYALQLAEQLGLDVDLVHFYGGSITPGKPLIITGDGSIQGSVHKRLQEFSKPNPLAPAYDWFDVPEDVTISYTTGISLTPSAAINKMAAGQDYDLVVMATHSYNGPIAKWLGSTAATVSRIVHQAGAAHSTQGQLFALQPHCGGQ